MATLTEMATDIQALIPEIPSFVADRQLLRATRVFCQETRAWRSSFQMSVIADTPTVSMVGLIPSSTELVDIISIKNTGGGEPVHPRTYTWLDQNTSDWRSDTDLNAKYYIRDSNTAIRLSPTPSETTAALYDVRAAVKPLLTSTTLDDVLVNRYREELISGALSYLLMIPRKPWTDLNLARYHQVMFEDSWPGARVAAAEEFQTGVPRTVKYGGL